jgi:hypothetical protein
MKNLKLIALSALAFVAIASMVFVSCQKKKSSTPIVTSKMSLKSQARVIETEIDEIKYDNLIKTSSYGLLDLSSNETFRRIVLEECKKQFDGDDNVLLKTLNDRLKEVGINLEDNMRNSLITNGQSEYIEFVYEAINGFSYFDKVIYIQVFIPFISEKTNIINTTPTICMNFDDNPILEGLSKKNDAVNISDIDEKNARINNVFVISSNEIVDNLGELPTSINDRVGGNSNGQKTANAGDVPLFINRINIKDKKEEWGNGRADLCQITKTVRTNCIVNDNIVGAPFCKLANSNLNSWYTPLFNNQAPTWMSRDYVYWADWEPTSNGEKLYTFIYEEDRRNKFKKNAFPVNGCSNIQFDFISKESEYGTLIPNYNDFTGNYLNYSVKQYSLYSPNENKFEIKGFTIQ